MWVIKEQGETWTGEYFRNTILTENLIPFLRNDQNVIDVNQVTLVHDKAPCFKALATQQLLQDNAIDFFGNNEWPGNSPDLNPCENVGAIIKDRVETRMHKLRGPNPYSIATLRNALTEVLAAMEFDTQLFESLLRSYPRRLAAVRQARGGHTDY